MFLLKLGFLSRLVALSSLTVPIEEPGKGRVLILTSSMGAGHDVVSKELARRLEERGYGCHLMDMVEVLPWGFGKMIRGFYSAVIRWMPSVYKQIYRVWIQPPGDNRASMSPVTSLMGRQINRWVRDNQPSAIVSTFHVCTQAAGRLKEQGLVSIPLANVIVDFAVHGLWVHPQVNLYLCLHSSGETGVRRTLDRLRAGERGMRVVAAGPIVRREFLEGAADRLELRQSIGIGETESTVLAVGGSWGAGELIRTVRSILSSGDFTPVVVCGSNRILRWRIRRVCARAERGKALGWVDDMAGLMRAADVMVENAGGLSAMEAAASLLPIVSFRPIPGHGAANVEAMAKAGVSSYPRSVDELGVDLRDLSIAGERRETQVATAAAMFRGEPSDEIVALIEGMSR